MSNKFFSKSYDSDSSDSSDASDASDSNDNIKKQESQSKIRPKTKSESESEKSEDSSDFSDSEQDNNNIKGTKIKDTMFDVTSLITLRYIKDGKAARTYIEGLKYFFAEEETNKIAKEIQKKLSTGYFSQGESHGFNGDHRLKLEKLLHTQYNIPKNKIKVC